MKQGSIRGLVLATVLALLLPALAHAAKPDQAIDQLLQQAEAVRSTNPKALAETLQKLDDLGGEASDSQKRQIRLLHAYQKIVTGQYDSAVKDALQVYADAPEAAVKFRSALLVANGAAITRDFSLGLRYLENALALQDQISDRDLRHLGFVVAGILYNQYGQFVLGQHYAEQILAQEASPRNRCVARQLRVEALFGLGAPLSDEEITNSATECDAQRESIASNLLRGYLARRWAAQDKKVQAIELLEAHLSEVEATGYPRLIGEINGLLAEYRLSTGDLVGAEFHAHRA